MTTVGPFLPVATLQIGAKEHIEAHKVLHQWFNSVHGGDPGPGSGGGAGIHWVAPGRVVGDTYTGPFVFSGARTISGVIVYAETPPTGDRTCMLDVLVNGDSLWADPNDRPTIGALDTAPKEVLLTVPYAVAKLDVVKGYFFRGGGAAGVFLGLLT